MYIRFLILFCFLFAGFSSLEAAAPEKYLELAAGRMKDNTSVHANFKQIKKLKAFRMPLTITGELCMDRSGKFAWHVYTPVRYSCIIRDGKLMQWDADTGKTYTLSLQSNAGLRYLAQSLQNYFSGNFIEMKKDFIPITWTKDQFLVMEPKKGIPASAFIKEIRFRFSKDFRSLEQVHIRETTGDLAEVYFTEMKLNQAIPEAKWLPGGK